MSFSVQFLHIITWKNNKIIKIVIAQTFGSMQDPILSAFESGCPKNFGILKAGI